MMYDAHFDSDILVKSPVLCVLADNPRASEFEHHLGSCANKFCRKCKVRYYILRTINNYKPSERVYLCKKTRAEGERLYAPIKLDHEVYTFYFYFHFKATKDNATQIQERMSIFKKRFKKYKTVRMYI